MSPLGYHTRFHLQDNRAILKDADQRREAARIVLEQGRAYDLLVFSFPDTHGHLLPRCDARRANRLNQRIESSLKQRLNLPVSFVSYPPEPIRTQSQLYNTVRYILTQHRRHDLRLAQFIEATNIPDLVSMRLVGDYTRVNLVQAIPRLRRDKILRWADLTDLRQLDDPVSALGAATRAATALSTLTGKSPAVLEAKRAVLKIIGSRLRGVDTAALLGISLRSVFALKHRPVNTALVETIRLQLGYRQTDAGSSLPCDKGDHFSQSI